MKKGFVFGLLAVLAIAGCQTRELDYAPQQESKHFTATIEDNFNDGETRTFMDENGNVRWKRGDQVSIFAGSTVNEQYQVTDASDGKTSAAFSKVSGGGFVGGGEIDNNVAFYPYASTAEIAKSGSAYVISDVTLPATQNYAEASFGNGAFPMAAVTTSTTDMNLKFKNVLGGLKLQLKGTASIASISVAGNQNEILCGAAAVTVSNGSAPSVSLTDASAKTVTLDCGDGVQLDAETATPFVIALPPMTMEGGFTVVVTDTEGKQMEIKTTKTQTINRSNLLKMPAVDYVGEGSSQPNNVIYYTSTHGYPISPYNRNAFGAEIISHDYVNGKGIITFSSDVKMIGTNAFNQCGDLKSISIPNSVTTIGESAFGTCYNLETINIPEGVISIGPAAFSSCSKLTNITIPKCVSSIGASAFVDCNNIISLTIPESVSSIGMYAFAECEALKWVYFLNPNPITVDYSIFDEVTEFRLFVPSSSVNSYKTTSGWNYYSKHIYAIPESVDLGLSIKWATFNIGANNPDESGDYFAWGETTAKVNYSWSNYAFGSSSSNITKYNASDGKTVLDDSDDAAHINWGSSWRMPTFVEWQALCNTENFEWTWDDTLKGFRVTSKIPGYEGNSIFLPSSGARDGAELHGEADFGNYWSSSIWPYTSLEYITPGVAWSTNFYYYNSNANLNGTGYDRYRGHPIRPVSD